MAAAFFTEKSLSSSRNFLSSECLKDKSGVHLLNFNREPFEREDLIDESITLLDITNNLNFQLTTFQMVLLTQNTRK